MGIEDLIIESDEQQEKMNPKANSLIGLRGNSL